jgi:GDPmannose 4,6-dehydratase
MSCAIITGITGQDGSYLCEYLLDIGYKVVGMKRRSSSDNTGRLSNVLDNANFLLVDGDITDCASLSGVFDAATQFFGKPPSECYNLCAQSHVKTSFEQPIYTFNVNAIGVINILELIRSKYSETRLYQASTSEMFGNNHKVDCNNVKYQDLTVQFSPRSPYAIAKVAAHQSVGLYKESYGVFGCCGVLFNHGSPRRGEQFVERKVTKYVASLYHALKKNYTHPKLKLGNINSCRDFGHAKDYVRAMHMMLQQDKPNNYIVATGVAHSITHLCEVAFNCIGQDYHDWITIDPNLFRPSEVDYLCGDSLLTQQTLGWKPTISFSNMIREMVTSDMMGCIA